jgi:hypothetical protein
MCTGVAIFANNKKALYAKKTTSHSDGAKELKINEDKFRKFEYLWWHRKIQQVHYDNVAEDILKEIDEKKATELVERLVKNKLTKEKDLVKWLKNVTGEWDKLLDPKFERLARKVNPLLLTFKDKIEKFKKQPIEKYNPYQATKIPSLKAIKKVIPHQVGHQVWNQVGNQVRNQVGDQVWNQVWNQVGDQVWNQVRNQVRNQVWNQVRTTSYWAIKVVLGLPIKHWFFNFLKLGVMIVFVEGKVKVFGKKGKYLGEYDQKEFNK